MLDKLKKEEKKHEQSRKINILGQTPLFSLKLSDIIFFKKMMYQNKFFGTHYIFAITFITTQ